MDSEKLILNFHYNNERARILRKTETRAEKLLWERLRNKQVNGLKFRKQHPIGYFVSDFYCHEIKLALELEGEIHDKGKQKEYDKIRKELINTFGYTIIEFKNKQIYNNIEKVIQNIKEIAKKIKNTTPSLSSQEREMEGEVVFLTSPLTHLLKGEGNK